MAVQTFVPTFSGDAVVTATLGAAASTAEIVLGIQQLFLISSAGDFHVKFGNAGMAAAAATDFLFPANTVQTLYTGDHTDRIRVFSTAGGTYWIQKLDRS
jgi:hypothetical protein